MIRSANALLCFPLQTPPRCRRAKLDGETKREKERHCGKEGPRPGARRRPTCVESSATLCATRVHWNLHSAIAPPSFLFLGVHERACVLCCVRGRARGGRFELPAVLAVRVAGAMLTNANTIPARSSK